MEGLDVASLRLAFASGSMTPSNLAAELHPKLVATGPAFIHLVPLPQLRKRAAELEAMDPKDRGALWGMPFAVKDNADVAGVPTTAACAEFTYTPERSSPAVGALLAAGAQWGCWMGRAGASTPCGRTWAKPTPHRIHMPGTGLASCSMVNCRLRSSRARTHSRPAPPSPALTFTLVRPPPHTQTQSRAHAQAPSLWASQTWTSLRRAWSARARHTARRQTRSTRASSPAAPHQARPCWWAGVGEDEGEGAALGARLRHLRLWDGRGLLEVF
jgi:hypothetical protein